MGTESKNEDYTLYLDGVPISDLQEPERGRLSAE